MIVHLLGSWWVQQRLKRAVVPEAEAVKLAERKGFKVVATQMRRDIKMRVNDKPVRIEVRADLMLTKWRRRYAGLVQSDALDPAARDARLQLLEFKVGFDVHGVILVDLAGRKLQRIEFDRGLRSPTALLLLFLGVVLGAVWECLYDPTEAVLWAFRTYCLPLVT